jgi:hypothetical protein
MSKLDSSNVILHALGVKMVTTHKFHISCSMSKIEIEIVLPKLHKRDMQHSGALVLKAGVKFGKAIINVIICVQYRPFAQQNRQES